MPTQNSCQLPISFMLMRLEDAVPHSAGVKTSIRKLYPTEHYDRSRCKLFGTEDG